GGCLVSSRCPGQIHDGHSAQSPSGRRYNVPLRCVPAVAASCPFGSPVRCHARGSAAPEIAGSVPRTAAQRPPCCASTAPQRCPWHAACSPKFPCSLAAHPQHNHSKRDGSPAPRRTITAWPLDRSTTVVGISPHSPESTTASTR